MSGGTTLVRTTGCGLAWIVTTAKRFGRMERCSIEVSTQFIGGYMKVCLLVVACTVLVVVQSSTVIRATKTVAN